MKGVRRGRISRAGVVKSARPSINGEALGDEGELTLRLGAATPDIGDVSDEDADEDGALLVAGYASLTPLRVPTRTRTRDSTASFIRPWKRSPGT